MSEAPSKSDVDQQVGSRNHPTSLGAVASSSAPAQAVSNDTTVGAVAANSYSEALTAAAMLARAPSLMQSTSILNPKMNLVPLQHLSASVAPAVLPCQRHNQMLPVVPTAPLHMQFAMPVNALKPSHTQNGYMMMKKEQEIPPIFRNRELRSGKWPVEEEAYANLLIELFEKGHINEVNGRTLRSFLSRKLHCAPMRISKKYAGKGIGKMVFLSKRNFNGLPLISPQAYASNMARLQEAETNFWKSIFPETSKPSRDLHGRYAATISETTPNGLAPIIPAPPPASNTVTVAPTQIGGPANATLPLWSPGVPQQALLKLPVANSNALRPVALPSSMHVPIPAKFLNQVPQGVTNDQKTTQQQPASVKANNSIGQGLAPKLPEALHQAYLSAVKSAETPGHNETNKAVLNTTAKKAVQGSVNDANENTRYTKAPPSTNGQALTAHMPVKACEIPDFLSGFDKVAGQMNSQALGVDPTTQHSPTFTSKSFDDFHRFLGKDLSPLTSTKKGSVDTNELPKIPNPETAPNPSTTGVVYPSVGPPSLANAMVVATSPVTTSVMACKPTTAPVGLMQNLQSNVGSLSTENQFVPGSQQARPSSEQILPNPTTVDHNSALLGQSYTEALSAVSMQVGADSYNIFAQQSALAASQHSAYVGNRNKPKSTHNFGSTHQLATQASVLTSIRDSNANVVSEPSNASDQGTEESDDSPGESSGGSGNEGLADSDESNSEASSRKKPRISYTKSSEWEHRRSNHVDD